MCKLRKQTFVRTDILYVTEHSIFNIQNLFQLAHFPGTERVLGCQGLFDFVIYAEVPRQCELNKFIYIALGFRVYLQRYPKFYVQQIIDQSYALTLSAGCLVLRAEPVLDFSQAFYLDSLAEISFAEGYIERCTALWREAASIAEESAVTEEDSLNHSGFLQPLGVCCHRMSMMDSTLLPTVRCSVMSSRVTPYSPMRTDIAIMESCPCRRQLCGRTALSLVTLYSASPVIRPSVGKSPGRIQNKYS